MSLLDDVLARYEALDPEEPEDLKKRREIEKLALDATAHMRWVPNPGPQTEAYYCEADQLLYGGEAGGGKSDLLIGLATQEHQRSLLLRRLNKDVSWLVDRTAEVMDTRKGYNGQDDRWTMPDGRVIDYSGCQHPGDEQRSKGRPKDFIGFDEASDFLEGQVSFIIGWLRSTIKGQRCRVVFATNPPTSVDGEWIVRWFAPWVDPAHPLYPYPVGKLLWTCRGDDDEWLWFDEPGPQQVGNRQVKTFSRTFIRSGLSDNPALANTNYRTQLQAMPEELRRRYERGEFTAGADDDEFQVIPTEWIRLAQERWTPDGGRSVPMTSMGVDVAQGGKDMTVFSRRHGSWFDNLLTWKGIETTDGPAVAGRILQHVRDAAQVNIDLGGGWGGSAFDHLKGLEIATFGFVPSAQSTGRTRDGKLSFLNLRAEAIWKFREAMDPGNRDPVAMPPDPQLRADLACYRWQLRSNGVIQIESKEDIKKRLGRSPDRGDAVILAHCNGESRVQPRRNDTRTRQKVATTSRMQIRRIY
jgi:hypothetical protein